MWTSRCHTVVSAPRTCTVCAADGSARSSLSTPPPPRFTFHSHKIYETGSQAKFLTPSNRAKRSIPSASATKSSAPLSESGPTLDQASQSATAWASDLKATHVGEQIVNPAPAGGKTTVRAASEHMGTGTPTGASPMAALRTFVAMTHTACFRFPRGWRARTRRSCCARGVQRMSR